MTNHILKDFETSLHCQHGMADPWWHGLSCVVPVGLCIFFFSNACLNSHIFVPTFTWHFLSVVITFWKKMKLLIRILPPLLQITAWHFCLRSQPLSVSNALLWVFNHGCWLMKYSHDGILCLARPHTSSLDWAWRQHFLLRGHYFKMIQNGLVSTECSLLTH